MLEYIINILGSIFNPLEFWGSKSINTYIDNEPVYVTVDEYLELERNYKELSHNFSVQKVDYEVLQTKLKKAINNNKVIEIELKKKNIKYANLVNVIAEQKEILIQKEKELEHIMKTNLIEGKFVGQQTTLIEEKDKKILELMTLCNEFERNLDVQDAFILKFKDIIANYKQEIARINLEKKLLVQSLKQKDNRISELINMNKILEVELNNYKKD